MQNPLDRTVKSIFTMIAIGATMKARVHYLLSNGIEDRKYVAIYAKGFGSDLVSPTAVSN